MYKIYSICIFLLLSFLAGCKGQSLDERPTEAPSPSSTATLVAKVAIPPTRTSSYPTTQTVMTPAATGASTPLPRTSIRYQQLEVLPTLPGEVIPEGTLVLTGPPGGTSALYSYDFTLGSMEIIPGDNSCFSVSPDGERYIYWNSPEDDPSLGWVVFADRNGNEINQFPYQDDWFGCPHWVDSQRIFFNIWRLPSDFPPALPVEIIDLTTGEGQELASDYPNLEPNPTGPGGNAIHFVNSTVIYHPSLDLVIYPETVGERNFVVLWDRKENRALAKVEDIGMFRHAPVWSPDGEQFLVAVSKRFEDLGEGLYIVDEEWFNATKDGKVKQLTYFMNDFSYTEIGPASWSPDGTRLGFWLATRPGLCSEEDTPGLTYFAVMEIDTLQVTHYCIPGNSMRGLQAAWSVDGKFVAVESWVGGVGRTLLVSIERGWMTEISTDLSPAGWLAAP